MAADARKLVGGLVVTSGAAGLAVHQAVGADADIDNRLAQTAVLLALTLSFGLFTLRATVFRGTGRGAHGVHASAEEAACET